MNAKYTKRFRPQIEVLEKRLVTAADIDFNNGVVEIEATDAGSVVRVFHENPADAASDVRVVIENSQGQVLEQDTFERDDVQAFSLELGDLSSYVSTHTIFEVNVPRIEHVMNLEYVRWVVAGSSADETLIVEREPNTADDYRLAIQSDAGAVVIERIADAQEVGFVRLLGLGGADTLINDTSFRSLLRGGDGNDSIYGGSSVDFITGDAGDDFLSGGSDTDNYSFSFDEQAPFNLGHDTIDESANVDEDGLNFGDLDGITIDLALTTRQTVSAGVLDLTLTSATGIEDVLGTYSNDVIRGNSRDNFLYGIDGNDRLEGRGGNDELNGGSGSDIYVFSGSANLGIDAITEYYEHDGIDTLDFSASGYAVSVNLGRDDEQIIRSGFLSLDLDDTGWGSVHIENVLGSSYDDWIYGNDLDNRLSGRGGTDYLFGFDGDDTLLGGTGMDRLYGGADDDTLDGGYDGCQDYLHGSSGRDTFIRYYTRTYQRGSYIWTVDQDEDYLADFFSGSDTIETRYPRR